MNPSQNSLPVLHASRLAEPDPDCRWMIEPLWLRSAVGIVGGPPKANKTYLALDIALSVASATPCLGTFPVRDPGTVLIYMAEDSQATIKERILALCRHRDLALDALPIHVITAPVLRLDLPADRHRLATTLEIYKPKLLVLDPLVRMHAVNENDAKEISALLGYLRELQRSHRTSVLLVHHARKNGSSSASGGQNLRGSGDLHAWSDSSLYLRRRGHKVIVTPEHRSAPAPDPLALALIGASNEQSDAHLEIVDNTAEADPERVQLEDKLIECLRAAPQSRTQLRATLHVRNEKLGHLLDHLAAQGRIVHHQNLWRVPFPQAHQGNGTGALRMPA